jgi:putative MATE family efflux protein
MDHATQMGEGKVPQLLLKFSIPVIIGMMVTALYNVVDRIYVGRGVGSDGLAGITVSMPLMILMLAFAMLVGFGATSLISIRLGEKKKDEAEQILGHGLVLLIITSLILTIVGLLFIEPLLILFGASSSILPYARDYLTIILLGGVFHGVSFGINSIIRAEGNPRFAMLTMLVGGVLNTILDPLFIFTFKMGVQGAAIATILSQAVSTAWVILYFLNGPSTLKFHWKNLKLKRVIVLKIFAVGSAPFAMQVAASILTVILNIGLQRHGGDVAIAAMGIVNSIAMLILMPIFGINQGAQPIIGYNYGAQRFDRVKYTLTLAIAAATAIVITGFIAVQLFSVQLFTLFSKDDLALITLGSRALRVFMLMLPIIGFQVVSSSYFQATGKPKQAMILALSRQVLILIPAVLILPRYFGLNGILYAGPVSDFASSLVAAVWLIIELRHLDSKHAETQINLDDISQAQSLKDPA